MNHERYNAVPAQLPPELPALTREQGKRIAWAILRHFWPELRAHNGYWVRPRP